MKTRLITLLFCLATSTNYSQCLNADSLSTINITHSNAVAKWHPAPISNNYIIHYRELGVVNWSNLSNITGNDSTRNIPNLNPLTTYEWQIKTYCVVANQPNSGWSYSDTFTTIAFVPEVFNPIITKTLSGTECNTQTELYINITQEANEPDIGTGTIISDGGSFNINSISTGDSVGYTTMTTATQSITAILEAGIILGQNYAVINSYDTTGLLIGFFTIENNNGGVKIEVLGSPNDGNNYTSGYISELYFTNLFINPQNSGPLHFVGDITSELNDQIYTSDTTEIWCNTAGNIDAVFDTKEIIAVYDILGRKSNIRMNTIQFIKFSDGTIKRLIYIKN